MKPRLLQRTLFCASISLSTVFAEVRLPSIISDHMVLKKSAAAPIWGWADANEEVTVSLDGQTATTKAAPDGTWRVELNLKSAAPGPFDLLVNGKNSLKVSDVLIGEVWVASGQSNMEFPLRNTVDSEAEIAQSGNPLLRQFLVPHAAKPKPAEDCSGKWVVATPQTTGSFSGAGYYFAKFLQEELKTPVGFINDAWGSTCIEAWTSDQSIETIPQLKKGKDSRNQALAEYPRLKSDFVSQFQKWLKKTNREDRECSDISPFAAETLSSTEGWTAVRLPGDVAASGLPSNGAIWLRKEVVVPSQSADQSWSLRLGPFEGFERVYWNGKLMEETSLQNYPGAGSSHHYYLPANVVKAGTNILALRIFAPTGTIKMTADLGFGSISLAGEWMIKAEYELPKLDSAEAAKAPNPPKIPSGELDIAGYLFNGMINPLLPYGISGVIWYQGESNVKRAWQYRTTLPLLIKDWRRHWKRDDLPFYLCQLPSYNGKNDQPKESSWAELREAQSLACRLPHTGVAILVDLGESGNVHPGNKRTVGKRLADLVLAKEYGKEGVFTGPTYDSIEIQGRQVRVRFAVPTGGLMAKPVSDTYTVSTQSKQTAPLTRNSPKSEIEGFAICGSDRKWVWADARIDGDTVLVWSDLISDPMAVRYAWSDNPTCNLYNQAGLPAAPFRSDDFPAQTTDQSY